MTATAVKPLERPEDLEGVFIPSDILEVWLARFGWTYHQLARHEFPRPFDRLAEEQGRDFALQQFQLACLSSRASWWCGAFLKDPDDPEKPWTYWDYQLESADYEGNTLHECGAEVGKTREILGKLMHKAFTVPYGSALVCGPMDAHVKEIIRALEWQLGHNEILAECLKTHQKAPYHFMEFTNGFTIDYRPTGSYGVSLRGVHAKTLAVMDEAVKAKNPEIFEEFWGRGKPSCAFKLYSTPDGDRSSIFFRLCQKAEGKLKKEEEDVHTKALKFKKFHWGKPLMPAPFWTPERREFYREQFGGEDSPQYQRVVLGNWGDPENSVFPWFQFKKLLKHIPQYRLLKILVDESQGTVSLRGTCYQLRGGSTEAEEVVLDDRAMDKGSFDIGSEIRAFFSNIPGLKFGAADLGFSQDPTELYVKLVIGKTHRLVARVQLKGVSYDLQTEAIDALDDVFDAGETKMGWGVDFGNAGSAVVHNLHGLEKYLHKDYEGRLTGYQFGALYDSIDEEGEVIIDKRTQKPVRVTAKELATEILVKKMQRQELEYPLGDPDIAMFYPNHTYREGSHHRIFRKEDDHTIDADRVLTLRAVLPGEGMEEVFACGN